MRFSNARGWWQSQPPCVIKIRSDLDFNQNSKLFVLTTITPISWELYSPVWIMAIKTAVGDKMCWWRFWNIGDLNKIFKNLYWIFHQDEFLVSNIPHRSLTLTYNDAGDRLKCHQHAECDWHTFFCHQHLKLITTIKSPTWRCRQHHCRLWKQGYGRVFSTFGEMAIFYFSVLLHPLFFLKWIYLIKKTLKKISLYPTELWIESAKVN